MTSVQLTATWRASVKFTIDAGDKDYASDNVSLIPWVDKLLLPLTADSTHGINNLLARDSVRKGQHLKIQLEQ